MLKQIENPLTFESITYVSCLSLVLKKFPSRRFIGFQGSSPTCSFVEAQLSEESVLFAAVY